MRNERGQDGMDSGKMVSLRMVSGCVMGVLESWRAGVCWSMEYLQCCTCLQYSTYGAVQVQIQYSIAHGIHLTRQGFWCWCWCWYKQKCKPVKAMQASKGKASKCKQACASKRGSEGLTDLPFHSVVSGRRNLEILLGSRGCASYSRLFFGWPQHSLTVAPRSYLPTLSYYYCRKTEEWKMGHSHTRHIHPSIPFPVLSVSPLPSRLGCPLPFPLPTSLLNTHLHPTPPSLSFSLFSLCCSLFTHSLVSLAFAAACIRVCRISRSARHTHKCAFPPTGA